MSQITVRTTHSKVDNKTFRFDTVITLQGTSGPAQTQLVDKRELRSLSFITAKTDAERREQFAQFLNEVVGMKAKRAIANTIMKVQQLKKEAN